MSETVKTFGIHEVTRFHEVVRVQVRCVHYAASLALICSLAKRSKGSSHIDIVGEFMLSGEGAPLSLRSPGGHLDFANNIHIHVEISAKHFPL